MDRERLFEHLNEVISVERFAAESYPQYAQQTRDQEVKATLREFGAESERHYQVAQDLMDEMGGNPSGLMEAAAFTLAWGKGFADVLRRGRSGQVLNLRDLLLTEYRDRLDWAILQEVATETADARIAEAVAKVLPDEERHISWLEKKVKEMSLQLIAVQAETGTTPEAEAEPEARRRRHYHRAHHGMTTIEVTESEPKAEDESGGQTLPPSPS